MPLMLAPKYYFAALVFAIAELNGSQHELLV